jgi:hypothetical protein
MSAVNEVNITIAERMKAKLSSYEKEVRLEFDTARLDLARKRQNLVMRHRDERSWQQDIQAARHVAESRFRAERFRKGLIGLWDRVTGRHSAIRKQNEAEYEQAKQRDEAERQTLIERQLQERRQLQHQIKAIRSRHDRQSAMLQSDLRDYTPALKHAFNDSPTYKQGKKLKNARNDL